MHVLWMLYGHLSINLTTVAELDEMKSGVLFNRDVFSSTIPYLCNFFG